MDGGEVEVWLAITPIRDADGTIIGASSIARDIGELKRAQRNLERSNAELEEFAYVASHDLSEPLRSIGGFVQLLERRYKGQLDSEADSFIDFIGTGVDRLQALIDDLLSYSRAGQGELRSEPVDSRELVERTLASLDAVVRDSGAQVELGHLPTVRTDPRVLGQVFQNLLSNALKFTNHSRPQVEVSAEQEREAWSFAVADNGIGIDPDNAERIFGMFQRLHGREEYGGTGIGLAICKRMVERVGGRIWCEPSPGGGTVFRFTIPGSEEPS
jgi:light-regulated signal transduction histidine kinase (bacteriophytochrome)